MDQDVATAAVILGFGLPPIISALNRTKWSSAVRGIVAFVVCVVAALAVLWYEDLLNTVDIRNTIGLIFGLAITTYNLFWKPTGIAPAIEEATG